MNLSKWWIFSNNLFFFWQNSVFKISADFVTRFEKFMRKLFFCSSSGSRDIREKHKFQKQLDVFFCYSLYATLYPLISPNFRKFWIHNPNTHILRAISEIYYLCQCNGIKPWKVLLTSGLISFYSLNIEYYLT